MLLFTTQVLAAPLHKRPMRLVELQLTSHTYVCNAVACKAQTGFCDNKPLCTMHENW